MHGRSPARAGNGIAKPLKGAPQFAARGCNLLRYNLSGSLAGAGGGSPTITGPASMQQVAEWLEKLGLAQYAQRFAENDISFSVLPDLTDQHLKEIGVSFTRRRGLRLVASGLCVIVLASRILVIPLSVRHVRTA